MAQPEFYQVLSLAVADLAEHGFDSQQRLDMWLARLRATAPGALKPQELLIRALEQNLEQTYRRSIRSARLIKKHPDVSEFTIAQVRPKLRAELDRRIMASVQLIRLNRTTSIERTLQRFAGWATSIPIGGSDITNRAETKQEIRRSIASLPYIERRVIIDQNFKLAAAIDDLIATAGGAIAAKWHHVKEGGGYQARPEHVARDGNIYLLRQSWAQKQRFVKPGKAGYSDEITQPAEEVYCRCVPGSTRIPFANVQTVYRRWYEGIIFEVTTASGKSLRLTSNHPVLAMHGWRAANALNIGDQIAESAYQIVKTPCEENENNAIPTIAEIFDFLAPTGSQCIADGASHQFHGDGIANSNVDIVSTNRTLRINSKSSLSQRSNEFCLANTNKARSIAGSLFEHGVSLWLAAKSMAGVYRAATLDFLRFIIEAYSRRFRIAPQGYSRLFQPPRDYGLANSVSWGNCRRGSAPLISGDDFGHGQIDALSEQKCRLGFIANANTSPPKAAPNSGIGDFVSLCEIHGIDASKIRLGQIVDIKRLPFAGHIYNLKTEDGWYSAEGIITHNCSYTYIYSLRDLPADMLTTRGKEALLEARKKAA